MMLPEIRRGLTVARCLSGEGLSFRWAPCAELCVRKSGMFLRVSDALVDSPEFRVGKKVSESIGKYG